MTLSRRTFVGGAAAVLASGLSRLQEAQGNRRPNIVWIVCHDIHAPLIGCYGNKVAATPTIDRMAGKGIQFQNAFSTAPVCAPSRFALVTGMYASACGPAQNMRANGALPANAKALPLHMRAAGYYCTNNVFTDYNLAGDQDALWDACDIKAHWRNRPAGKPFFCVYDYLITHESRVFGHEKTQTDPASVPLPPFLPDKPGVRSVLARNIDIVNKQDAAVAHLLGELKEDGLEDDTFVFFVADHGGVHPRSKRYLFDDGLHVPLIVQVPKNFASLAHDPVGQPSKRVVSLIDMAPTVLSIASVPIPSNMTGRPIMGPIKPKSRRFAFSMRDRMDERYDLSFSIRDERYRYTRNYTSQRIYAQHESYEWQSDAYQAWEEAQSTGELNEVQSRFWKAKPVEEYYDLQTDPHSIHNLIDAPDQRAHADEMRRALDAMILDINDNGFIPEGLEIEGHDQSRAAGVYPLREIMKVASAGLQKHPKNIPSFLEGLHDPNEVIRYWNAQGLTLLATLPDPVLTSMEQRLGAESSVVVRCALAEALITHGRLDAAIASMIDIATRQGSVRFQLRALNVLSAAPIHSLRPHRAIFEQLTHSSDTYVPEDAYYTLLQIDGTYQPSASTMPAGRRPTALGTSAKPIGDPMV